MFHQDRSDRFKGYPEINILSVGDPSLDTAGIIGTSIDMSVIIEKAIVPFRSAEEGGVESVSILEALHGVDRKHRMSQRGM